MSELLLRGGRPGRCAGPADVLVRDGVIARIEPDIDAPGAEVFDVSGRLVLPGLVEAHCHLDKTLYGRAWEPHTAGDTLADRIGNERRRRGELGLPNADCAAVLLERMVTAGTSYVRTHTDVYPGAGLRGVEAVRDAVRRLGGRVTVGSDPGYIYQTWGFSYIQELEMLQEAGFAPLEVIQAATINGAREIYEPKGEEPPFGLVRPGMLADLVIVCRSWHSPLHAPAGSGGVVPAPFCRD